MIIHMPVLAHTSSSWWARSRSTGRRRLLLRLGLYGGAIFLGLPAAFCHVMTSTVRQPVHPPPPDYEAIVVESSGLKLRGWLGRASASAPPLPAVLIVHGFGDSLESYDSLAGLFRRRGHSVLLIDLRAHGGSEGRVT